MSEDGRLQAFLSESVERIDRHLDKTLPPAGEPPTVLHEDVPSVDSTIARTPAAVPWPGLTTRTLKSVSLICSSSCG